MRCLVFIYIVHVYIFRDDTEDTQRIKQIQPNVKEIKYRVIEKDGRDLKPL
jgi:lipopolysaccharide biosynthesis protein